METLSTKEATVMSEERGYSAASVALGFILGGVLGASLAMLFAPESGRRTRERLRDLAADVRDKTIDISEELRDKAEDVMDRGREVFEEKRSMLSAAVQAGKEAVQRERQRLSSS
jgi:gas vesicle protein